MSYRQKHSDSWKAAKGDSWRPWTDNPDTEADRQQYTPWARDERKDYASRDRRGILVRGDSWRPPERQEYALTRLEENAGQLKPNSTNGRQVNRPSQPEGPRAEEERTAGQKLSTSVQTHSQLHPSLGPIYSHPLGQGTLNNGNCFQPLRFANASETGPSRAGGKKAGRPASHPSNRHRYSWRSKSSTAQIPNNILENCKQVPQSDQRGEHYLRPVERVSTLPGSPGHGGKFGPQRVRPPPTPTATGLYLAQARLPVVRCAIAKKLLVVLDLNGTLLLRPNRAQPRNFHLRPGVHVLLAYLFENHVVMVYSSARPENVEVMVDALVSKKRVKEVAAIWGRDKMDLTAKQYNEKVQVYKRLEKVWSDEKIQATCVAGQRWGQANTVLVDDSRLKASSQPHNLILVPEFTKKQDLDNTERQREVQVVATIMAKLEELKWTHDVSRHILRWQIGELEQPSSTMLSLSVPREANEGPQKILSGFQLDATNCESSDDEDTAGGHGVSLETDMEKLTTGSGPKDGHVRMHEPAISAEEWKDFLK